MMLALFDVVACTVTGVCVPDLAQKENEIMRAEVMALRRDTARVGAAVSIPVAPNPAALDAPFLGSGSQVRLCQTFSSLGNGTVGCGVEYTAVKGGPCCVARQGCPCGVEFLPL